MRCARLLLFKSLSAKLGHVLALYGGWGLFAISFLDSSFLSFPLVNDLLLIHLSGQTPRKAVVYALQCTFGSGLGASLVYALARGGGDVLWRRRSPHKMKGVERWLERNDFVAILVASLLPPPVPLKIFLIGAGVLRVNFLRFTVALLVGRGLRFAAAAWLGARYGARAEAYLKQNIGWVSLATVAILLVTTLLYGRLSNRLCGAPPAGPDSISSDLR